MGLRHRRTALLIHRTGGNSNRTVDLDAQLGRNEKALAIGAVASRLERRRQGGRR
jgi:hypothetical protein